MLVKVPSSSSEGNSILLPFPKVFEMCVKHGSHQPSLSAHVTSLVKSLMSPAQVFIGSCTRLLWTLSSSAEIVQLEGFWLLTASSDKCWTNTVITVFLSIILSNSSYKRIASILGSFLLSFFFIFSRAAHGVFLEGFLIEKRAKVIKKCCLQSKKMQWTDLGAAILKYNLQIVRYVSDFIYMKQLHQT